MTTAPSYDAIRASHYQALRTLALCMAYLQELGDAGDPLAEHLASEAGTALDGVTRAITDAALVLHENDNES